MYTLGSTVHLIPTSRHACRKLIRAFAKGPEQVAWNDVQDALASALAT